MSKQAIRSFIVDMYRLKDLLTCLLIKMHVATTVLTAIGTFLKLA